MLVSWYNLVKLDFFILLPLSIIFILFFGWQWNWVILVPLFLLGLFGHLHNEEVYAGRDNEQAITEMIKEAGIEIEE